MRVPFLDLSRRWAVVRDEVDVAISKTISDAQFILGRRVSDFENAFARAFGFGGAVGVASGTDALFLALKACGVGSGDEVITTPFTFIATAESIWNTGAKPVFVDIDPATFNINPYQIEDAITDNTVAILPVHLFGHPADMDPISLIALGHGLHVIEDAAQAIGARYKGNYVGGIGDLGAFSFFPSKNLGGAGDGGIVAGNHEYALPLLRELRQHGKSNNGWFEAVGWNSRLDAIQAVILDKMLLHLAGWNILRRTHAAAYTEALSALDWLVLPEAVYFVDHVYNQYVVRCQDRDGLKSHLEARGVGTRVYYDTPLHLQPCFSTLGYHPGDFPYAERASKECLSLPLYPELRRDERDYVIESVLNFAPDA